MLQCFFAILLKFLACILFCNKNSNIMEEMKKINITNTCIRLRIWYNPLIAGVAQW